MYSQSETVINPPVIYLFPNCSQPTLMLSGTICTAGESRFKRKEKNGTKTLLRRVPSSTTSKSLYGSLW